ncbi:MAG: dihydrodipicolinate reductase [Bryobacterales bacterium]|nr:dihydrodipicolinate reductase [Bryobacterales bacterium]
MSSPASKLALVGYGRMGRLVEELAPAHGFEVALRLDEFNNQAAAGITRENFDGVDVAIDFSIPDAVADNAVRIAGLGVPLAIGTTGWLDQLDRVRAVVERHGGAVVYGANFSIGVNAFYRVVGAAARAFAAQGDYDAFLYEAHHKYKKDAPSGTALRLLDVVREAGYARSVDVATQRSGQFPGIHEIGFDSAADTIRVSHTARNREGFASGSLKAARWIMGQRGIYEFSQVWDRLD